MACFFSLASYLFIHPSTSLFSFLLTRTEHIYLAVVLLYERSFSFVFFVCSFFAFFLAENNVQGGG